MIAIALAVLATAFTARLYTLGVDSKEIKPFVGVIKSNELRTCDTEINSEMNCYKGSIDIDDKEILEKLVRIFKELDIQIVKNEGNYLYGIYKSPLFGFIDDIEFFYDSSSKKLKYRSASRVGKSDLGANKDRIDEIFFILNE